MRPHALARAVILSALLTVPAKAAEVPASTPKLPPPSNRGTNPAIRYFAATGVLEAIGAGAKTVVIQHEAISNLMGAMTMEFKVKEPKNLDGLATGDSISFRLAVTAEESWVDQIARTKAAVGAPPVAPETNRSPEQRPQSGDARARHPLLDYRFTNELGQAVSLGQFSGQALAITFFFTRCPIPEYCPRLSKNFQAASQKLGSLPTAPTNWHFLSVTIDPEIDTPKVLKAYAEAYGYDRGHWSFLTGPTNAVAELARESGATFEPDSGFFNHNFRTLIVDAAGRLQMVFPTSGDLSEAIVQEMLKAAAVTNGAARVVSHP